MGSDDEIDDVLDDIKHHVDSADGAAEELGDAKEDFDKTKDDALDGDQDTADKAANATDQGTNAMRHMGQALEELGIDDPGFAKVANNIDYWADEILGKKRPPPRLPPYKYRVYFGKKERLDLLESYAQSALGDAVDGVDSGIEYLAGKNAVASWIVGTDTVGSMVGERDPFHEDAAELEEHESSWQVARIDLREALNEPFRAELILWRDEGRNAAMEARYGAMDTGGGLLDSVIEPVESAIETVNRARGTVNALQNHPDYAEDELLDHVEDLASDPLGAGMDMLTGKRDGNPEAHTYINIPIDPRNFLGQTCSLRITREFDTDASLFEIEAGYPYVTRWVTGIVTEMDDLGIRLPTGINRSRRFIRLVIEPSLARLRLRRDCRIFHELNTIEIVRRVCRDAGIYGLLPDLPGVSTATEGIAKGVGYVPGAGNVLGDAHSGQFIRTLPPIDVQPVHWTKCREMCVQYNETDLAFIERLLEEEGINYTFESKRGFERLVLVDDPTRLDQTDTVDGRALPFYWPDNTTPAKLETFKHTGERRRLRSGKVTLRDFNFSDGSLAATELAANDLALTAAESSGPRLVHLSRPRALSIHRRRRDPLPRLRRRAGQGPRHRAARAR